MTSDDLTLRVLIEIRDEIRSTNARVDQTNARLDLTNQRLENVRDELGRRIVESEIRTATAIGDLASAVRDVHGLLSDRLDLRDRVERCERDIDELKRTVKAS
ncbi:MAG: hypothetical protein H0T79_11600 [Deltaproteobacteria bacterium]|nr:hypothetical protein [Deltaproteobacteria bacterium]